MRTNYFKLVNYASRISYKCTFKLWQRLALIYKVFIKLLKPIGTVCLAAKECWTLLLRLVFVHNTTSHRQNSPGALVTLALHLFILCKLVVLQRQVVEASRLLWFNSFNLLSEQISLRLKLVQDVRDDVYKLLVLTEI